MTKICVLQTVFAVEFLMGLPKPIWLDRNIRRTSGGGNRSGLSSPYDSSNPPGPSPQQPGTKTTSAPTSPLKVLSFTPVKCKSIGLVASFTNPLPTLFTLPVSILASLNPFNPWFSPINLAENTCKKLLSILLLCSQFSFKFIQYLLQICLFAGTAWEQESFISRQGFKSFTGETNRWIWTMTWINQVVSAKANEAKDKAEAFKAQRAQRHDRCFTLLVIDDQNTDWSKVISCTYC